MKRPNKNDGRPRLSLPAETLRAIEALDRQLTKRRTAYRAALRAISRLPSRDQPAAWLRYVSRYIESNGDQEAVVFLRSRGHASTAEVDEIVTQWRAAEKKAFESGTGGFSSFDAEAGEQKSIPATPIDRGRDIRRMSRIELRNFWWGYDHQEFTIDATMLRTVEWCNIGGFDEWWERLAIGAREDFLGGGVSAIPACYWLFSMCRSDYGRRLLGRTLEHVLEALEMRAYGDHYQWHVPEPRPATAPTVRILSHLGCVSSVMFANGLLKPGRVASEALAAATRDILRYQDDSGFLADIFRDRPSIETTAMAVHALALVKPDGWQRAVRRAAKWLMTKQENGHWVERAMPDPVYLTVLVLDAIVLAGEAKKPLTFSLLASTDEPRATAASKRRFRVALSFPGEIRPLVRKIAQRLARDHGQAHVFYDEYYKSELARPNLDLYLQSIYAEHSDLVVVFVCCDYDKKEWCGLEWRAVRDLIKERKPIA